MKKNSAKSAIRDFKFMYISPNFTILKAAIVGGLGGRGGLANFRPIYPGTRVQKWIGSSDEIQTPVHASNLPHSRYIPRPSHFHDFIARTILGEDCRFVANVSLTAIC